MGGNGEKDTSKNLQPMSIYYVHALSQFVTYGQGATDFHAKTPEKKDRTGLVSLYDCSEPG